MLPKYLSVSWLGGLRIWRKMEKVKVHLRVLGTVSSEFNYFAKKYVNSLINRKVLKKLSEVSE